MKKRSTRLEAVKNLIKTRQIESQTVLLELLQNEGFEVTQATLSRDLKLLKVGKIPDDKKGYIYTLAAEDETHTEHLYSQDFLRGYTSIRYSGNTVVIKTHSGHSNTVAEALDCLAVEGVLGTLAGDNCIFVCLEENVSGERFLQNLKEKIPELPERNTPECT